MLMNQLDQYGVKKHFKVVNVEKVLSKGLKLPPGVDSVPSLMLMPQKRILTGKPLFDYLLLPNKGLIFMLDKMNVSPPGASPKESAEPTAFGFKSNESSDLFSFIEDESQTNDPHKPYNWASIHEEEKIITPLEGDVKNKGLPDLSQLQAERALDIQNHLNSIPLPPASTHA